MSRRAKGYDEEPEEEASERAGGAAFSSLDDDPDRDTGASAALGSAKLSEHDRDFVAFLRAAGKTPKSRHLRLEAMLALLKAGRPYFAAKAITIAAGL